MEWLLWLQNPQVLSILIAAGLGVISGGTGLTGGTSGGILAFDSDTSMISSGLLTNHALMLGGGAGAAPSTPISLGMTTTVLHGNAAGNPSWGAVSLSVDVSGNLPVNHLNSGTSASAATFWRGDGTWAATGAVTNVTASSPLGSSGGTTPNISIVSSTGSGAIALATLPTLVGVQISGGTLSKTAGNGYLSSTAGDGMTVSGYGSAYDIMFRASNDLPVAYIPHNTAEFDVNGLLTATTFNVSALPAFVAADKYVIVDASGNFHQSALGPAS